MPLAALAAVLVAIDVIGLGIHWADAVNRSFATDSPPNRARTSVASPDAVVPGGVAVGGDTAKPRRTLAVQPVGCLSAANACFAGNPTPTTTPAPVAGPPAPATPPTVKPTPLAQADLAVPALGTQVNLGLGDGGCTAVNLTVLSLGNCPAAEGDGPIILNLGGTLLGQK